jgi:hypothetical protein
MSDLDTARQSKGGLRFETATNDLAPAITQTHELTLVDPKAKAAAKERARHLFRHWIFLISGILIGAAMIIFINLSSSLETVRETAVEPASQIKVAAVDPAPATQIEVAAAPKTETQAQEVVQASAEPETGNIVNYAQQRTVSLEPRKFLYVSGDGRSYDPGFASSDANAQVDYAGSSKQAFSLRPLDGSQGRYQLNGTSIEWQGGWQTNDPAQNIRVGSAYIDYLNKTFGSGVGNSLSAINRDAAPMLGKMPRAAQAPAAVKQHSSGLR